MVVRAASADHGVLIVGYYSSGVLSRALVSRTFWVIKNVVQRVGRERVLIAACKGQGT